MMGLFDFLKKPVLEHPEFGEMKFSGGFWQCTAAYIGYAGVIVRLRGTRNGIDRAVLELCDSFEGQFKSTTGEIGEVLYAESYMPIREAIDTGNFPNVGGAGIPVISSSADVWKHLQVVQVEFGATGEPGLVEVAFRAEWEIEHILGIGIRDGKFDYFNGSVLLAG